MNFGDADTLHKMNNKTNFVKVLVFQDNQRKETTKPPLNQNFYSHSMILPNDYFDENSMKVIKHDKSMTILVNNNAKFIERMNTSEYGLPGNYLPPANIEMKLKSKVNEKRIQKLKENAKHEENKVIEEELKGFPINNQDEGENSLNQGFAIKLNIGVNEVFNDKNENALTKKEVNLNNLKNKKKRHSKSSY